MAIIDQKDNYELYKEYQNRLKPSVDVLKSSLQQCVGIINNMQSLTNYNTVASPAEKTFLNNALVWCNNNISQIPSFPD